MCAADFRLPLRKNMAKTIAGYVAKGLRVVKVYRTVAVGVCSCGKGRDCPMPGKHPIGYSWASSPNSSATDEEVVMEWWADDHTAPNVGVILGPTYGVPGRPVFDVEADNAEGIAILKTLGLDRFETPTYESGKSPHRLFQHEDGLPPTNVFTWKGVEVRLGGAGGQEQSVMPPSIHHTGKMYRWVDGFSLDDVDIAPVPPSLKDWILTAYDLYLQSGNDDEAGKAKRRGRALLKRPHYETARERHGALMSFAGLLSRAVHLGDEDDEHLFLRALRAVNQTQCVPPKPDDEVVACWRDALKYRALDTASAKLCEGIAIKGCGYDQQFVPDGLTLTIVKSDPPSYRLFCEAWKKFNGTGVANLSAEDFMSAKKAAVALAAQVGGLRLDRWPGDWARIWDGRAGRAKTKRSEGEDAVVGLRTLLVDEAVAAGRIEEVVDPARHRLRRLANHLYAALARCASHYRINDERTERDDYVLFNRGAQWVFASEGDDAPVLWFAWHTIWAEVEKAYRVEANEGGRLMAAMPEIIGRRLAARKKQINGQRASFRTLTQEEWARLEAFALGDSEENPSDSQEVFSVEPLPENEGMSGTLVRGAENDVICV